MKENNFLLAVAMVAVIVSVIGAGVSYYSISDLASKISLTGLATGTANLTVETLAEINFTNNTLSFGSGRVANGADAAYLDSTTGTVKNGNWTAVDGGLVLENIGNVNVTLNLTAGKTAAQFLGGTSPLYRWNLSNIEANSCLNSTGGTGALNIGLYFNVNTSSTLFCGIFQFINSADRLTLEFNLSVPVDSSTGALGDVITATAVAL